MYYKYDLKNGIAGEWRMFFLPLIIACIACFSFTSEIKGFERIGQLDREVFFSDVIIFIFKGEPPFDPTDPDKFRFPFLWLINQLSISFIAGKYPFSEIYNNHGAYVLIKGKSRKKWIASKFLWIITVCIIYYTIIFLTIFVYSWLSNYLFDFTLNMADSSVLLSPTYDIDAIKLIRIYLLPLVTSVALSFLQIAVSMVFNSVFGFAFVLGVCGVSIFYESIFAIGNCSLLIRNEIFSQSNISTNKSYLILLIVAIMAFLFGIFYFENCDILQNRRNE